MLTSRAWIISSGLVGTISLMLRSALNFSFTGPRFFLPTLSPCFIIINGIIFALAASASFFGNGSDSPATEHHHNDNDHNQYEYDHNHNHDHDHDRSSYNSFDSSFDQNIIKDHEKDKFPVGSKSEGSNDVRRPVSSPDVRFPSTIPEESAGLRRPPTAPVKPVPLDDKSGDENETMEEMWKRVKAEKQPTKPNTWQSHVISRNDSRISTSSCPSPSRARKPPPSPARSGTKLMERIPSWVKLKKELSMGRDELNSRVEDFIRKFNDEMKLQRLESQKRYKLFRRPSDEK